MSRVRIRVNASAPTLSPVVSVNGRTGAVLLDKTDVGLGNVDNTADADKPISTATQTALDDKVDKVQGKGLSTNDYTDAEKTKLDGIEAGAEVNAIETVKVNGTALTPDANKAVDIPAYQKPSGGIPASDLEPGAIPTVPDAYTSNPATAGTASPGIASSWARGDHVHPHDSTKADASDLSAEAAARASEDNALWDAIRGVSTIRDWKALQSVIRAGKASKLLSVGDQLVCRRNGADLVWDVIGIDCETLADTQDNEGLTHSVTLALHDCLAGLQFDAREALFYFENGLAAGTYHFTVTARSGVGADVGKTFQFTLAQAIQTGGQLVLDVSSSVTLAGSTAKTYAGATSATVIETVTITEGSSGTNLGDVNNTISGGTNSLQRATIGNGNYKESAIRQFINSSAAAGSVWSPQNVWDRAPSWNSNTAGFLNGMDEDFLSVIGEVIKKTALNTVCEAGSYTTTTEKFFPLACSEVYGGTTAVGDEGTAYPYYSDYSDLNSAGTGNDSNRVKYRNGSTEGWYLRSPETNNAAIVRYVYKQGQITSTEPTTERGIAPACCIV